MKVDRPSSGRADRRRAVIALVITIGLGAIPGRCAFAQTRRGNLRLALLDESSEHNERNLWPLFFKRLRELGYAEGDNLTVERRYADGKLERLAPMSVELAGLNPDIIGVRSTPAAQAAMRATRSIPVVFMEAADPVGAGLVQTLARPGGNVTGISSSDVDFAVKWIELLREIAPAAKRIAYLSDARNEAAQLVFGRLRQQADRVGMSIQFFDGGVPSQLIQSFDTIARERLDGVLVGAAASVLQQRDQIVAFAARQKLPVVYARREYADAGGLLSYGADPTAIYVHGAEYVDRIARGAKPADLPVMRPSGILTVLNGRTARALGIRIPNSVRARADEVIE
jgi:putative tryptophan/tyrosine transport system substrate-binding protein